jgi:hypothetical protein
MPSRSLPIQNAPCLHESQFFNTLKLSVLLLALVALWSVCVFGQATEPAANGNGKATVVGAEVFRAMPLAFEANRGQADGTTEFVAHGRGYTVLIGDESVRLQLGAGSRPLGGARITFPGAGVGNSAAGDSLLQLRTNYIAGRDRAHWYTDIPNYERVRYSDVFPGADLSFYGKEGHLEYDFTLRPGHDTDELRFGLSGTQRQTINDAGDLVFSVGDEELRFLKPVAYQVDAKGKRTPVAVGYQRMAAAEGEAGRYGFKVGSYDHSRALVIDPVLEYGEQLSTSYDQIAGMTADASGNSYLTGITSSEQGFYVLKLGPTGTALVQTTVTSTGSYVYPTGIAADSSGNFYVVGSAYAGLPATSNAYQATNSSSGWNPFLAVIAASGSSVSYLSYLGGSGGNDFANAVALDGNGGVYVGGQTESGNFPVTAGVYDTTQSTSNTGFVAKFNPAASGAASLVYSTLIPDIYYGVYAIAANSAGDVYFTGEMVPGYPISNGAYAYDGEYAADGGAYVTELNATGTALVYSAYLGYGEGDAIALDSSGDAYVTGEVYGEDFPATSGAYQVDYPDGFVTELNSTGTALVYSTFLSGPSGEGAGSRVHPRSLELKPACASACSAYVAGYTSATDFPAVNAVQSAAGYEQSVFVAEVVGGGASALLSSYLGGIGAYSNFPYTPQSFTPTPDIAVDSSGNAYVGANLQVEIGPIAVTNTNCGSSCSSTYVAKIGAVAAGETIAAPDALNWGTELVGVNSALYDGAPLSVTLYNQGSAGVSISSVVAAPSPEFAETDNCSGAIAAGGYCTLQLTATPSADGVQTGTLTITSSAQNSPTTVALSVTGEDYAFFTYSPTSLTFGEQTEFTASTAQTFTLTNIGDVAGAPGIQTSANFTEVNNCPASLAPQASCTVQVQFDPQGLGYLSGEIYASGGAQNVNVAVSGTGVVSTSNTGSLAFSATALNFGTEAVGVAIPGQNLYATNTSAVPVTINSVAVTLTSAQGSAADFALSNYCGTPQQLNPQAECGISITFTPSVAATETANIVFTDTATGSPQSIALSGSGVADSQSLEFTPANWVFPAQPVGVLSAYQGFNVYNSGTAPVTIDRVVETGTSFQLYEQSCAGTVLQPVSSNPDNPPSCQIYVEFDPVATGSLTGTVTLYDAATGNPQVLNLMGTGVTAAGSVGAGTNALVFPAQAIGVSSVAQTIYLYNQGNVNVTVNSDAITGTNAGDFALSADSCAGQSVAANAGACYVYVVFTPTASGSRTGTLTFATTAGNVTVSLTGTGEADSLAVGLTPTSLNFGSETVGVSTSSLATNYVYIRNTGTEAEVLSGQPAISGTNAADFTVQATGACPFNGGSLAPGLDCYIYLQFTPSVVGGESATLTITDSAGTQTLALSGKGVSALPATYFEPLQLAFAEQTVGTVSSYQYVYFYNNSGASITLNGASISPSTNFLIQTNYCTGALATGGECGLYVEFAPTVAGYQTATLTLKDSANNSYTVALSGYAPALSNSAYLSPDEVMFPSTVVGATAGYYNTAGNIGVIELTNSGNAAFTVGSLNGSNVVVGSSTTGEFSTVTVNGQLGTDECSGTNVGAGTSCYVYVNFTPSATGSRAGSLVFPVTYANGTTTNFTAGLGGTGVAQQNSVTLAPTSTTFVDTVVGTVNTSGPYQAIQITNSGNQPVTVGTVSSADVDTTGSGSDFYDVSEGCSGTTIPARASCYVYVYFTPTAAGARTGSLVYPVTYAGSTTPVNLTAALSGNGIAKSNTAIVSPSSIQFDTQVVNSGGNYYNYYSATLTNSGNVADVIGTATITSGFLNASDGCSGVTVQPKGSCYIYVQFAPTTTGSITGTLTIPDSSTTTPHKVTLAGTSVTAANQLVLSQTSVAFPSQAPNTSSAQVTVYLTNQSTVALPITSVVLSGTNASDFRESDGCGGSSGTTLGAEGSCAIYLTFSPANGDTAGTKTAKVTETDPGTGSPRTITLTGTVVNPVPAATVYPTGLSFASQNVGTTSAAQTFSVTNTGGANLVITTLTLSNTTDFLISADGCSGQTVAAGNDCVVSVEFKPSTGGTRTGTISIPDNATGSPQTVSLTGAGTGTPVATLESSTIAFGNQNVNTSSSQQSVTLENTGTGTLNIASIVLGGTNASSFSESSTCGTTLAAGSSCSISATFTPTTTGALSAAITITDNSNGTAGSTQTVMLSGTGIGTGTATLSGSSLAFGSQSVGTTSLSQSITLSNTGNGTLTIAGIVDGGTDPGDFNVTNNCGASLAAGGNCSISATFTPEASGSRTATITITDNSSGVSGSTQTIALSGTGVPVAATPTFSPAPGSFTSAQSVTISDATSGVTIYYTTNGTTPTTSSTVYSGPITVSSTETIEAIAAGNGYSASAVASGTYTINPPAATPTFSPAPGSYTSAQSVTISDATSGVTIYYTTNGTTPTTSSTVYSGPVTVSSTETIEAIAAGNGYSASAVASGTYTINQVAATPTFSPAPGSFTSAQTVTISDATSGVTIYYTTNGTTPTTSSTVYGGPITVSSTETIEAIAAGNGYSASAVASGTYTINPPAATPTFSPAPGSYTSAQSVTISDATSGVTIYYTTNGTTPTTSSTVYSGPITVSSTETIEAIAAGNGYSASAVASGTYTIGKATPTVSVTNVSGNYGGAVTLKATDTGISGLPSPSGAATFTVNGTTAAGTSSCSTAGGVETCSLSYTLPTTLVGGSYSYSASFAADANYLAASGSGSLTVATDGTATLLSASPASISATATTTLTAAVENSAVSSVTPGGSVTFKLGTTSLGSCTLSGGTCTLTVSGSALAAGANTITGSYSGIANEFLSSTGTTTVTVTTAGPDITFSSVNHNFGEVVRDHEASYGVEVTNDDASAFEFSLSIDGPNTFTQINSCGKSLAGHATCEIVFTYRPVAAGEQTAVWSVKANGKTFSPSNGGTLTGTGVMRPSLSLSTSTHNFGTLTVGSVSGVYGAVLTNSYSDPIALSFSSSGNTKQFETVVNNCGATLPANSSCNLQYEFKPTKDGSLKEEINIKATDTKTHLHIPITSLGATVSGVTLEGTGN